MIEYAKYIRTKDNIYAVKEVHEDYYHCAVYKEETIDIPESEVLATSNKVIGLLNAIRVETEDKIIIDAVCNLGLYLDKQGMALPKRKIFGLINDEQIICRIYGRISMFLVR